MTEGTNEQQDYTGEKVSVTLVEGDPIEGKVEAQSTAGILVKLKGTTKTRLLRASEFTEITLLEDADAKLVASKVKPVKPSTVKRHLLNFHGQPLSEVNKLGIDQAIALHDDLHRIHKGEVGHVHVEGEEQ